MSNQYIAQVAIVVRDYDEAIAYYTEKLNFTLVEDTQLTPEKRWVSIIPPGAKGQCMFLLAKAANEEQKTRIGNQTGGRVFLFIKTTHFDVEYKKLVDKGVTIVREPVVETWGKVAVFADLYGNLIDFIDPDYSSEND